ncbi:MAG: preprotein translocase subunit SecG [Patescibacteria group bacterium]
MKSALLLSQIVIGICLTVLILLQAKGTGLGRTFGSISYHSKRGVEGLIFKLTVALAIAFVLLSVVAQLA